jgi:hypothetical protein
VESAEHIWIGDQITLEFGKDRVPAKGLPLRVTPWNQQPVTSIGYGQGIALGGDFYGVVGAPISTAADPQVAFRDAWASLASAVDFLSGRIELAAILLLMKEEVDAVEDAIRKGKQPSTVYSALGDRLSAGWTAVTAFRYVLLALENLDHFGVYAEKAYKAGHAVAMAAASRAGRHGVGADERRARMERAYAMNAFADHFLTDLFSAGHLRVPRMELYKMIPHDKVLSGRLTRTMHNEDALHGLSVRNAYDNAWMAYGDKRLLDDESVANREMVKRAVQISADEVANAMHGPVTDADGALKLAPDFRRIDPTLNTGPLFVSAGPQKAARRKNLFDTDDHTTTDNWDPRTTYRELVQGMPSVYQRIMGYDKETNKELGWLGITGSNTSPEVAFHEKESAAHGVSWKYDGGELYLQKDTDPNDRYLGLWSGGVAGWGLPGAWRSAVVYNTDGTISMAHDPKRMLCAERFLDGVWRAGWTDGTPNRYLIRIDMPLPVPNK